MMTCGKGRQDKHRKTRAGDKDRAEEVLLQLWPAAADCLRRWYVVPATTRYAARAPHLLHRVVALIVAHNGARQRHALLHAAAQLRRVQVLHAAEAHL